MNKTIIENNGSKIAVINSEDLVITDTQSALDLIMIVQYYDDCEIIILNKEAVTEDFFRLSSGLAGEILQKFSNYRKKIGITGDFSGYTSKPLHDFIYECNLGGNVAFAADVKNAADILTKR